MLRGDTGEWGGVWGDAEVLAFAGVGAGVTGRKDAEREALHETAGPRGVHERARRKVNGQGSPEAVLGHALGACVRMCSYSYSYGMHSRRFLK